MTTPFHLHVSIGARLASGFAIIIGLFLGTVALAESQHGVVHANLDRVNNQYFPNMVLADTVVNTANANVRSTLELLLSGDTGRTADHIGAIAADRAARAEALSKLAVAPQTDAGREAVIAISGLNDRANAALDTVLRALDAGNADDAKQRAQTALVPASDALVAAARALSESYDRGIDTYTDASIEATNAATTIMEAAAAVATLAAAALAFWLVRGITRPLATAVAAARQLSAGDTAIALQVDQHDEVGDLLRAMQQLAEGLSDITLTARRVAQGDLAAEVAPRGDQDTLALAFGDLLATMRALLQVTDRLGAAAREGRLDERGEAAHFDGAFATLVEGFNRTLDAMVQPINAAGEALDALADRDLTARVAGEYGGDYARMQQAINGATRSLNQALLTAAEGAQQVAAASVELAAEAQSTAQGASEQAATLEQVAASLQEVHSMARTSSEAAAQANTLAGSHRSLTLQSVDHMRRANVAMERIKEASDATARIVRTIDEFAFQTNLLALNAAVEAARAGDAGRSFAVVAEEVRELALRSAAAARSTAQLIDESAVRTAEGVACNQDALAALEEMAGCVDQLNGTLSEIVEAAEHQDLAVEQINLAIDQLNQVTQHSAATAEQSAAAAQELAHQAGQMLSVVETFTLQQPDHDTAPNPEAAERIPLRLVAV